MAQAELFAEDYKVDLEIFEGPLDLLLYLIRREELNIYDIPIGRITEQYMQYLDLMRQLNLDVAGEFIVMAATLMVIKSRMMLPVDRRQTDEGTDEEWVDPRLDLVRQLIEYKKFKDAAGRLAEYEALTQESFDYGGGRPKFEKSAADAADALASIDMFDLLTAFQEVLARLNEIPQEELKGMRWSVPDKMDSRAFARGWAGLVLDLVHGALAARRGDRDVPRPARAPAPASRDRLPERRVPRNHGPPLEGDAGRQAP